MKLLRYLLKGSNRRLLRYFISIFPDTYCRMRLYIKKRRGITHIPCLVPFTRMQFGGEGNVTTCCSTFTKVKTVGNMKKETIEEIWNGWEIQKLRRLMLLGDIDKICFPDCPFLAHEPIPIKKIKTDNEQKRMLKEDLELGKTKLRSHPSWFDLGNYDACNLHCIMCNRTDSKAIPDYVTKTHKNLANYYDKEITLHLTGNGDFLVRSDTRDLLKKFPQDKYPNVRFQILTNGLLFKSVWEGIKHCNYTLVNVSIDAATKGTYEKIRRGGRWETLMESLQLLKKLKEEGKFSDVVINMIVMRSNYKEIPLFVEMARRFGFISYFTKIRGSCGDENFFEMNDEETLEDLRRVLSDSSLYAEDVGMIHLSEYVPSVFKSKLYTHSAHWAYEKYL